MFKKKCLELLKETGERDMKILNVVLCIRVSLSRYFEKSLLELLDPKAEGIPL